MRLATTFQVLLGDVQSARKTGKLVIMMTFLSRKAKDYAEKRWNEKEHHLKEGDQIPLRQTKNSKLDTPFTKERQLGDSEVKQR